ncbi:MAG: M20/M25/M40 family metallo-hydrolase [Candidatus Riflebacteria bacterium]|nr:M20/M25/M40 family metallo-hydrolase [Candidatus Riflebacteria bacterium]
MKNFVRAGNIVVFIVLMLACATAAMAGQWIQVVTSETGYELIKKAGSGSETFCQLGDVLIINSGDVFNDQILKTDPVNVMPVRPGEKLYLITTKDPAVFNMVFPGTRTVYRDMGFIVLLAGETAAMNLMSKQTDFTKVELLPGNQVVLSRPLTTGITRIKSEDALAKFIDKLDMPAFMQDLTDLVDLKTRYSYVSQGQKAVDHCEEVLKEMGYATSQQPYNIGSSRTNNLIAEIKGSDEDKFGQVLIVGHLDSTSESPRSNAPGADDNGSGAAGVMALARLLHESGIKPAATVKFILFMGEEQGLYGSKAYVKALSATERPTIKAVFNLDMIGFDAVAPLSVMIETSSFNRPMVEKMQKLALDYADFTIHTSFNAWGSDHAPFLQAKIPAVLTIESEFSSNPNYHKTTDLIESINQGLCLQILRLNAAAMYAYAIDAGRLN